MRLVSKAILIVGSTNLMLLASAQGRCVSYQPENPGTEANCRRFNTNRLACEQIPQICHWVEGDFVARVTPVALRKISVTTSR